MSIHMGGHMVEGAVQADTREGLLFGERPNGSLVHISEVPSGLACNCRCPNCGTPLVARRGEQLGHHFGHHNTKGERACAGGPETALHRFAKELLAAKLAFMLPPLHRDGEGTARYAGGLHRFDTALLEHRLGAIVPDVIARRADRDLLVEFHVTHACDATKIAKIASLGTAAIEIDLSGLALNAPRAELEVAILERAPRRWLHNPKLGWVGDVHGPVTNRITPASSRSLTALERAYASAYREALSTPSQSLARQRVEADGLAFAIGIEVAGIGCFTASPRDWQAVILLNALEGALVGRSSIVSAKASLQQSRERGWLRPRFSRLTPAEAKALSAALPSYASPADAIAAWAMALSRQGILVPSSARGQWVIRRETLQRVREARQQKDS
ncbi:hypothetical protein Mext_0085 [Methylorubrum extorquens PA1]|nr:hypothetical protein Mext_0085 [Methylorubrum extorquens PA1]WIU39909.1 hypothetical protein KQ926_00440 [Methylorubrum extorquens]WIU39971.1 hypothetical protein KQ926_00875 [Methylorubrum extorquens]